MFKFLLLLLLTAIPIKASENSLTTSQICDAVAHEVEEAVKFGIINKQEANDIIIRCYVNYS